MIQVKDKNFTPYIDQSKIESRVKELADQINQDYDCKNPLFIAILNGAFMFASDLMKEISIPSEISFIKVKTYEKTESTGRMNKLVGLQEDVKGRNVIIIEDIIDTGHTMVEILRDIKSNGPASLEIVTILFKPEALNENFSIKYVGFEIPTKFVVGYGLDYDGYGRNLKGIYQIEE